MKKGKQNFSIQKFVRLDEEMANRLAILAEIKKSNESQVIREALVDLFQKYYETLKAQGV